MRRTLLLLLAASAALGGCQSNTLPYYLAHPGQPTMPAKNHLTSCHPAKSGVYMVPKVAHIKPFDPKLVHVPTQ